MMIWLGNGLILLCGIIIGVLVGRRLSVDRQRAAALEKELAELQSRHANHQQAVTQHFRKSANLFNELTARYHDMYTHLADGAQTLCKDAMTDEQLEQFTNKSITYQRIAQETPEIPEPKIPEEPNEPIAPPNPPDVPDTPESPEVPQPSDPEESPSEKSEDEKSREYA